MRMTMAKRSRYLLEFKANLDVRLSALQTEERTTSQQFNSQLIGTSEYVKDLAVLSTKASNAENSMEYMKSEAKKQSIIQFQSREWQSRTKLIPLRSRIRDVAAESFRSGTASKPIYVATTSNGVVLATVLDKQYIREAYRSDYRNTSINNPMTGAQADDITHSKYLWTTNASRRNSTQSPRMTKLLKQRYSTLKE